MEKLIDNDANEKLFFIIDGDLDEINDHLQKGWSVKSVHPVSESVATSGDYVVRGSVYAYIVLEKKG